MAFLDQFLQEHQTDIFHDGSYGGCQGSCRLSLIMQPY